MIDAAGIIARGRSRGLQISERRIIAARRAGLLPFVKDGLSYLSTEVDVDEWLDEGAQAPNLGAVLRPVGPRTETQSDEELALAKVCSMEPEALAAWVVALSTQLDEQRTRSARLETALGAARLENDRLRGELLALDSALACAERRALTAERRERQGSPQN